MFWSLFVFRGHSSLEPAFSRVTYFILRAYKGTDVNNLFYSVSLQKKHVLATANTGEIRRGFGKKMQVNGLEG